MSAESNDRAAEQVIEFLKSHRSVRSFAEGAGVPEEDERRIVEAAQSASTSCNMQTYSFISVRDPERLEKISACAGGNRTVERAGLLLVVCVDLFRTAYAAKKAGAEYVQGEYLESFIMAVTDAAIAAQNGVVAAEALGYGVCYIGSLRSGMEELIEILELPEKVFPLFGISIGVPKKVNRIKPRLPLDGVLFRERYDSAASERAVDSYDETMRESGVYEGRHFDPGKCRFLERRERDESTYGWIEHTARRVSSEDPSDTRPQLRSVLEKLGFSFD